MELNLRHLTVQVVDHCAQDHVGYVAALRHRGDKALCAPVARGFGFLWHVRMAGPLSVQCCTEFPENGMPSLRIRVRISANSPGRFG
jgi:hypothetical protein